jgi:hypothetical protein
MIGHQIISRKLQYLEEGNHEADEKERKFFNQKKSPTSE